MRENNEKGNNTEQGAADASRLHTLTIEQRKRITMTGVESVTAFSPQQISLTLADGKLVVTGSGLKIAAFSKTTGAFTATGNISALRYGGGGGKLARLFR